MPLIYNPFSLVLLWRRRVWLVLLCCLTASFVAPGLPQDDAQPAYNGQPLNHWIEVLGGPSLSSKWIPKVKDIKGGLEAQEAVRHIGTNGIPFLVRWIGGEPLFAADMSKQETLDFASPASRQEATNVAWASIRAKGAMQAFRVLGTSATSAIPELARLLTNQLAAELRPVRADEGVVQPPCAEFVLPALGGIGPDSLPVLLAVVTNTTYTSATRAMALEAVGAMGTNALAALPVLAQCTQESQEFVALTAVESLSTLAKSDQMALAALTNAVKNPLRGVRMRAVIALKPFGAQAVPALLYALNDASSGVRYNALGALIRAAPEALTNASVLALAAQGLRSSDSEAKLWAAQVLHAAGQQARGMRPKLEPLGPELTAICQQATNTLRQLAPELLDKPLPADAPRR